VHECDEVYLGAEVFRISGDRAQGLGAGAKQEVVNRLLVLVGDVHDRLGNGKDHMEVLNRGKQFCFRRRLGDARTTTLRLPALFTPKPKPIPLPEGSNLIARQERSQEIKHAVIQHADVERGPAPRLPTRKASVLQLRE
jgi:hypothetical protein